MSEPETDPEANPDPDPGTARDGRTDATGGGNGNDRPSYTELAARVEELSAKNDQLRQQVAAATRARYRRSAIVMALVGVVALAGAALFPDVRTVLVALGGTGVFAAVLTYFLTPERFVAASVGDALVEQFELVDGVDVDVEAGRATLAVDGSVYGPVDRFDHPVASLFATTLAVELDEPVALEVGEPDPTGDFELDNIGSGA